MRTPISIARGKYRRHRGNATDRGIPFLLSFGQWWSVWQRSGHWCQRGRRRGQYVMARFGDQGAYEVGNVRICTVADNMKERRLTAATRAKLSAGNRRRWAVWNSQLTEQHVQAAIAVAMRVSL
jgi:hypothetical protein